MQLSLVDGKLKWDVCLAMSTVLEVALRCIDDRACVGIKKIHLNVISKHHHHHHHHHHYHEHNLYLAWPLKTPLMIAGIGAKQLSTFGYRVAS